MKVYLTGQSQFGNRGCEALVRATAGLLRQRWPGAEIRVPSVDPSLDARQWPQAADHGVRFVPAPRVPSRFVQWNRVISRLPALAALPWPALPAGDALHAQLAECDAVLSIGGDNYSLDYDLGSLAFFVAIAEAALARQRPVLLWGASVGPFTARPAVEAHMMRHLQRLGAITVRETATEAYLRGLRLARPPHLVADPAFLLQPQPFDFAPCMPQGDDGVLGLNLSPLVDAVRRRAGAATALADEVVDWVTALVARTSLGVLLVPHVAPLDGAAANNDEHYLAALGERLAPLGARVRRLPAGLNAAELKHAIAQCRFFVGARTHATIAAMSSGVPTVSIAYSVKARGINRDLFGHERHVLDTRSLCAASLDRALAALQADEAALQALYRERLPQWRARAAAGVDVLAGLLPAEAP